MATRPTFFSLPLEIRQTVYEHLFNSSDKGIIEVGDCYGDQYDQLEPRREVMKADPRLCNEVQEWTSAHHKSAKKTRLCLCTNWEYAPTL